MKQKLHRSLALLLALVLLLGLLPMNVAAAEMQMVTLFEDAWDTSGLEGWISEETAPAITGYDGYVALRSEPTADNSRPANGLKSSTDFSQYIDYTVELRARINKWTTGPGSGINDNNSLALQIFPSTATRLMFTIEETGIKGSNASGTWKGVLNYPSDYDNTGWHTYKLVVTGSSAVAVYVDDVKLGDLAFQTAGNYETAGLKLYTKGNTSKFGSADVDYVKAYTTPSDGSASVTFLEDNFTTATVDTTSLWNAEVGGVWVTATEATLSNALKLSSNASKNNGTRYELNAITAERYSISFEGKVDNYVATAYGPGTGSGKDGNSLALQFIMGGQRFCLSIEDENIRATANGGTWGGTFSYPSSGFDKNGWNQFRVDVDASSAARTAAIYVNDTLVGTGGFTSNSTFTTDWIKFFAKGFSSYPVQSWVRNVKVTTQVASNAPSWAEGAAATVSDYTENGFTVTWPAADNAASYEISLDGGAAETVTDTSKTFTGLTRKATGQYYTISITAKNDSGASSTSSLSAKANTLYDFGSDTLDVYQIVAGKNNGGTTKYTNYRIPGIVATNAGTIITYYEARTTASDWASMDILAFRSEDQGETWSEPIMLAEGATIGATMNNPIMIVGNDADNTIHLLYCVEYGICTTCGTAATSTCTHGCGVFYRKSTDDGKTWSEAVNISDQTDPNSRNVIATGPGHGICLENGTLIATVWLVEKKNATGALNSHHPGSVATLYSKDNGATWQMGNIVPNDSTEPVLDPNETVAVETEDGGVMLNIRSGGGGYRALAYSPTGYDQWTTMEYHKDLIDPTCFGSVAKYDQTGDPYTLLLINCESKSSRSNLVVKGSTDNGKTWKLRQVIESGMAGYSDITVDNQGNIYVLYEVNAGVTCRLARFSYDWLFSSAAATLDTLTVVGAQEAFTFDGAEANTIYCEPGTAVTINAVPMLSDSVITIGGQAYTAGTDYSYDVTANAEPLEIVVTNGSNTKTYTLTFALKAPAQTMVMHLDGEDFNDNTPYGNNAAQTGVATEDAEDGYDKGKTFVFDATNTQTDMTVSPTNGMDMAADDFTVSAWFKTTTTANGVQQIVFWYGGNRSGAPQWWCRLRDDDIQFNVASDGTETTLTAEDVVTANTWNHVAVVRKGVNQYLYLNGEKVAEDASNAVRNVSGDDSLTIGVARNRSSLRIFQGNIDDVKVFNYALTAADIQNLMRGDVLQSPAKDITSFSIGGTDATISDDAISVALPYGTDVTALSPTIAVSDKATVFPASGVAQDFTNPVTYTVTAEDSTTKTYTVTVTLSENPDIAAVAAAKNAIVDGSVNVEYGVDQTAKTTAVQNYVNGLLANTPAAAGVEATVSHKGGDTYTVALSKGSASDSKDITMTVTEDTDPDIAIVNNALTAVNDATYANVSQSESYDTEEELKAYVEGIAIKALADANITDVTATATGTFTAAKAGDAGDTDGTDGTYVFTITVTKGAQSQTTGSKTVTITATSYVAPSTPPVHPARPITPIIPVITQDELPFEDVLWNDWFYDEVKDAYQNDLIDGMTPTLYKPYDNLTVAQAIKLAAALHQMDNLGKVTLTNGAPYWYDSYVDYAVANGIIEAKYDSYTLAQMNAPVTRREFVHIFYGAMPVSSYAAINTVADNAIPDVKLGDQCADEIYTFYRAGILTGGKADGSFLPNSNIKRSEVAAILIRMYDVTARESITLK